MKYSLLIIVFTFSFCSLVAYAQHDNRITVDLNGEYYVPVSKGFDDLYRLGYGLNASLGYRINTIKISTSLGVSNFFSQEHHDEFLAYVAPNIFAIPVDIGLNYYLLPQLYCHFDGGLVFYLNGNGQFVYKFEGGIDHLYKNFITGIKLESWNRNGSLVFGGLKIGYQF